MKKTQTWRLVFAALFLAMGMVLPFLTGQLKEIGDSLLPMHLAVMLCGVICGPSYGAVVGLCLPPLRGICFGMPPLYPNAVWMSAELLTYGLVIGVLYHRRPRYSRAYTFLCLICSMLAGRAVWGIAKAILLGLADKPFGFAAFWAGGFVDAIPGIILQLILVPLTVELLERKRIKADKHPQ